MSRVVDSSRLHLFVSPLLDHSDKLVDRSDLRSHLVDGLLCLLEEGLHLRLLIHYLFLHHKLVLLHNRLLVRKGLLFHHVGQDALCVGDEGAVEGVDFLDVSLMGRYCLPQHVFQLTDGAGLVATHLRHNYFIHDGLPDLLQDVGQSL